MADTVTLACTTPNGIVLQAENGSCPAVIAAGYAQQSNLTQASGTAFTSGIPADVWSTWSANNPQLTTGECPAVYEVSSP
jgi:hypothetical protein